MIMLMRSLLGSLVLIGLWQMLALSGLVPQQYFPPPLAVVEAAQDLTRRGELWPAIALTSTRAVLGLAGAIALALTLALLAARYAIVGRAVAPLADLFRSLPPAAITPFCIFIFGLGWKLYAFVLIFTCFWPIYLNCLSALQAVPNQQLASARIYGYEGWSRLLAVQLPAALPDTFIGIRLAAGISLIAAIAAEMLAGRDGLGHLMSDAAFSLRIADTFVGLVAVMGLGLALNHGVVLARGLMVRWHVTMTEMA